MNSESGLLNQYETPTAMPLRRDGDARKADVGVCYASGYGRTTLPSLSQSLLFRPALFVRPARSFHVEKHIGSPFIMRPHEASLLPHYYRNLLLASSPNPDSIYCGFLTITQGHSRPFAAAVIWAAYRLIITVITQQEIPHVLRVYTLALLACSCKSHFPENPVHCLPRGRGNCREFNSPIFPLIVSV